MPSARATLGALLCLVAGLLAYVSIDRANRPPTTRFAVATRDLAPGAVLGARDVAMVVMELPTSVRSRAVEGDSSVLDGVTVLGPVAKGELLQRGSLVRRSTPAPTFSFPVQAELAVAGRLRAGVRVGVYATDGTATQLVADDVLVVRVDGSDSARGTIVLTVALDGDIDETRFVAAASRLRLAVVEHGTRPDDADPATSPTAAVEGAGT